ncbi:response regulator [Geomesophilobacter sediminis]|uniref:Response regulator n=1 Tax=Geomesophilobacter sediminis TaxID=2798584 RepID=A0A8J7JCZ2_9BACT|nr:response regulator [Geomesophilobacter sediminis]MBJ6723189.1 response regulator [Geomesophilobacter sediminis]
MPRKKVLLVDDVEPFLEMEKALFNEDEFEIRLARDGYDCLRSIMESRPELIFMDLFMPRMGGLECCRIIKADRDLKTIPVVMVTASGYESDYESCREAGCDEVMPKPVTRYQVQAMARRMLGLRVRYEERAHVRLLVSYGSNNEFPLTDYSINLSTGGLFLETEALLSVGTRIQAEFVLPHDSSCIRCNAKIAWINSSYYQSNPQLAVGMGVQFLDLGLDHLEAIRTFVRTQNLVPAW